MKLTRVIALTVVAALSVVSAFADHYSWTQWDLGSVSPTATGTIASSTHGTIDVTLTGPFYDLVPNYPSWTPASTYADGTIVDNAPDSNAIVRLYTASTFTLTFSKPVDHVAFAAWSLGNGGQEVTYTFDHTLHLIAGGPSAEYGGSSITTPNDHSIRGMEGNGTVLFDGPITELTWTIDQGEFWHGFEIGLKTQQTAPQTPAPAAALTMAAGLLVRSRRRK